MDSNREFVFDSRGVVIGYQCVRCRKQCITRIFTTVAGYLRHSTRMHKIGLQETLPLEEAQELQVA